MICSSEKRFFTSNLLVVEDWTPNRRATQSRGGVGTITHPMRTLGKSTSGLRRLSLGLLICQTMADLRLRLNVFSCGSASWMCDERQIRTIKCSRRTGSALLTTGPLAQVALVATSPAFSGGVF
ncbi:hypothetical protein EKT70_15445 [Stenotrophomonas geniculata]|nr:hypothetical protein EKT70_15445 [Stenotrophomonas geniculata]